jgi:hypothetical protein
MTARRPCPAAPGPSGGRPDAMLTSSTASGYARLRIAQRAGVVRVQELLGLVQTDGLDLLG